MKILEHGDMKIILCNRREEIPADFKIPENSLIIDKDNFKVLKFVDFISESEPIFEMEKKIREINQNIGTSDYYSKFNGSVSSHEPIVKLNGKLLKEEQIQPKEEINFVVPTGNFGNILAAYYAKNMGIPIHKLICASNDNKVLYDFFETGVYDRNR